MGSKLQMSFRRASHLLLSTFRFMISRREAAVRLTYDTSRNFGCLVYLGVRDCRADGRARADKVSLHNFIFILNSEVFEISQILANIALALVKGIRLFCL